MRNGQKAIALRAQAYANRLVKKSRYIPKRLLARVEKLEVEKVPVREILKVLTNKDRSQK